MNRGSRSNACRCRSNALPFNEAPIHESGKYRQAHATLQANAPFNEAPIHESGK